MNLRTSFNKHIAFGKETFISTPNISLAPDATWNHSENSGRLARYDYGSATHPKPSKILSSEWNLCSISHPKTVINGDGYNNGPRWLALPEGALMGWHSWRKPGVLPFKNAGSSNVWIANFRSGKANENICMPLKSIKNTSYPAFARSGAGPLWMCFTGRDGLSLGIAKSTEENKWKVQAKNIFDFPVECADICMNTSGDLLLACAGKKDGKWHVFISESNNGRDWSGPKSIFTSDVKVARPRISRDSKGVVWVVWHSDFWDPCEAEVVCEIKNGRFEETIKTNRTSGNHCWVWNGVVVESLNDPKNRFVFDFRRNADPRAGKYLKGCYRRLLQSDCLYSREKGFGFNKTVEAMCRIKGDGINKEMFYSHEDRKFTCNLPNGKYRVKNYLSSWISSVKDCELNIPSIKKKIKVAQMNKNREQVFISCTNRDGRWSAAIPVPYSGIESNRPSKVIELSENKYRLFFTGVNKNGINITARDFMLKDRNE
ncbi:MAG: hypothetical protein HZC17_06705 [Candidatus Omnitrophica bacterium]|nr:hypothetical protein [Candidatus Omnitrophota bacterium]